MTLSTARLLAVILLGFPCTLDGSHFSATGYALLAKVLIPALTPLLNPTSP